MGLNKRGPHFGDDKESYSPCCQLLVDLQHLLNNRFAQFCTVAQKHINLKEKTTF